MRFLRAARRGRSVRATSRPGRRPGGERRNPSTVPFEAPIMQAACHHPERRRLLLGELRGGKRKVVGASSFPRDGRAPDGDPQRPTRPVHGASVSPLSFDLNVAGFHIVTARPRDRGLPPCHGLLGDPGRRRRRSRFRSSRRGLRSAEVVPAARAITGCSFTLAPMRRRPADRNRAEAFCGDAFRMNAIDRTNPSIGSSNDRNDA